MVAYRYEIVADLSHLGVFKKLLDEVALGSALHLSESDYFREAPLEIEVHFFSFIEE
jgi:hypothetical protein